MAFAGELRQSTAVDVLIGPFVDDADGDTPATGLTLDVELSKNGQGLANKTDATAPVHDAGGTVDGYYNCELDATDTGTLGNLTLVVHHADALPIRLDFSIVTANYWDSKYSTDKLEVDLIQMGGVAQSATDLKDFADAGYDPATNKVTGVVLVDTTTTNTDMAGTDNAALASVLGAAVGVSISADIADLPTVAEFEARSIVSADYVVTTDTIAGVTLVGTCTTNTDLVSAADIIGTEVDNDGTAISLAGAMKLLISAASGKVSGAGTTTVTIRDAADSKDRIVATVDADGNRSAIGTRDAT